MVTDLRKRRLVQALSLAPALLPAAGQVAAAERSGRYRIAFGSCLHQNKSQPIWQPILDARPDLFVFLGDNIYGDSDNPDVLRRKYRRLGRKAGFRALRESIPLMAIWDDHDYGRNDAGSEYEIKEESRRIMLEFWQEPEGSPRWTSPGGIHTSRLIEHAGRKIHIILPDLRWNRSPLLGVESMQEYRALEEQNLGPYFAHESADATLVGDLQWQWLEAEFAVPADLKVIGSSIQCLAEFTGWETWANFPRERERLLDLIDTCACPTLLLSGDVHWCELSQVSGHAREVLELTSSGLTEIWEQISPNRHRVGEAHATENFGLVDVEFGQGVLLLDLSVRDVEGKTLISHSQSYSMG